MPVLPVPIVSQMSVSVSFLTVAVIILAVSVITIQPSSSMAQAVLPWLRRPFSLAQSSRRQGIQMQLVYFIF
jgi:hypothetical protein